MKTFRLIGMALIAILLSATACSDGSGEDYPVTPPTPEKPKSEIKVDSSITTNGVSFSNKAGEQSVSFSSNEKWTLSIAETRSGTTWVTPSATSGNAGNVTITFKVTENTDYEDRSVSITIKAGTATITFKITQKGVDAMLVTTTTYEVPQEGATIDIEVQANINYTMEISEAAKGWITEASSRVLKTNKHSLKIAANEEYEKREGEIYFKSGDKKESVHVYQTGGAIILLSQNEFTVSDKGETISVEIKSNCEYGVQMPDVDWIIDESSRSASSHTLKYTIETNEGYDNRSAQIIFYDKNSELKDTMTINQCQLNTIILSQKEYSIKSEGDTIEVKLNTNVDFETKMPDVDWITLNKSRALTEHTFNFIITENENEEARQAQIIFVNKENEVSDTLFIKQLQFINTTNVNLKEPGTLMSTLINKDWLNIYSLKITGPLNGDDIRYLRQMLGGNEFREKGKLTILDLNGATIVKGGSPYYTPYTISIANEGEIGSYMFESCSNLQVILLPNDITTLGYAAFMGCTKLTDITLPDSLSKIDHFVFAECTNLVNIKIPTSVKEIGPAALQNTSITEIVIPEGVTNITQTFMGCIKLTKVTLPQSLTALNGHTFNGCKSLTSINLPTNLKGIMYSDFQDCVKLTSITIPSKVVCVLNDAFKGCISLKEVRIKAMPDTLERIHTTAFRDVYDIATLYIPKGTKEKYYYTELGNFKTIIEE